MKTAGSPKCHKREQKTACYFLTIVKRPAENPKAEMMLSIESVYDSQREPIWTKIIE